MNEYLLNFFKCQTKLIKGEKLDVNDSSITYIKDIPKKLYKFRECNDNNFDSLKTRKAWFSLPKSWYDQRDVRINLDIENDIKKLSKREKNHFNTIMIKHLKALKDFPEQERDLLTININEIINKYQINGQLFIGEFKKDMSKKFTNEEVKYLIKKYSRFFTLNPINRIDFIIKNTIDELLNHFDELRAKWAMYSLTDNYKHESLWEKYAKRGEGFCIEYNTQVKEFSKFLGSVFPIQYSQNKNVSLIPNLDVALSTKVNIFEDVEKIVGNYFVSLFTKDTSWAFEKEWRILASGQIDSNKKDINGKEVDFDFVSAIYLGENINNENKETLLDISNKLNVPVYQRNFNINKSNWEYIMIKPKSTTL